MKLYYCETNGNDVVIVENNAGETASLTAYAFRNDATFPQLRPDRFSEDDTALEAMCHNWLTAWTEVTGCDELWEMFRGGVPAYYPHPSMEEIMLGGGIRIISEIEF